ncbi:mitochondrial inner membrane protease subunit 1 isoform X2 [Hydra vulgaris]|uniref:Mitochondrial inner membrane protease subunit n=1 Tax=Hydra vulgaris TaxID=6087 RepID=A0ABM4BAK2_HYDVU
MLQINVVLKKTRMIFFTSVNVFCWSHCIVEYGGELTLLTGPSMQPTFNQYQDSTIVFTSRSLWRKFQVGDIVVARSPSNPKQMVCKRIAAVEGERVERHKVVLGETTKKYVKIPKGHVWLLGDNSNNSTDSRTYGPVPLALIRGRVCFKIW